MKLIRIIVTIAVVGLVLWLIGAFIPMPAIIWNVLLGGSAILLVIWLIRESGLLGMMNDGP
jgi:hypothetical protein